VRTRATWATVRGRTLAGLAGLAAVALAGTLGACGSGFSPVVTKAGSPATPSADPSEVDVLTWWNYGAAEKSSREGIERLFAERFPATRYVDRWVDGEEYSTQGVMERVERDRGLVDVYQTWSDDVWRMDDDSGQAQDISALYDELGLRDVIPAGALDRLTVDGKIYRVSLVVSRANVLWSDRRVLVDAGLDPDATYGSVDEWIAALRAVRAAGEQPLVLGAWWTRQLLLDDILLSELGRDAYTGLWDGRTSWDGADVRRAFADFETVVGLARDPDLGADWPQLADRLVDHEAAFLVTGDWAEARFVSAHRARGVDYDAVAMPGTDGTFLAGWGSADFAMRAGAPHPDGARAWLGLVASREVQGEVAATLGQLPVRTDVDPSGFDDYMREEMTSWREDAIVSSLTLGGVLDHDGQIAVDDAATTYLRHTIDVQGLRARIAAAVAAVRLRSAGS